MSEPLRDYRAAAEWLSVPQRWLEDQVREGKAPHTRLGKHVRFSQAHLDAIVAAGEKSPRRATPTPDAPTTPTGPRRPRPMPRRGRRPASA